LAHFPPTPRHEPGRPFPDRSPTCWSGDLYEPNDHLKAKQPRRLPGATLGPQSGDRVADPPNCTTALGPYPRPGSRTVRLWPCQASIHAREEMSGDRGAAGTNHGDPGTPCCGCRDRPAVRGSAAPRTPGRPYRHGRPPRRRRPCLGGPNPPTRLTAAHPADRSVWPTPAWPRRGTDHVVELVARIEEPGPPVAPPGAHSVSARRPRDHVDQG
jgi:hypothetical protein